MIPQTEEEILEELTPAQRKHAEKYKYANYYFVIKIKDLIENHKKGKLHDTETFGWIDKLIDLYA